MNELMVSVWCLAYNHEKYIRDCLEGFVNQKTNFKFEVIVHDDASTDGTPKIIEEYAKKYPSIIKPIYQKENQYSKGINIIKEYIKPKLTGKYVAVCEGDDFWCDRTKLQTQVDLMEQHLEYVACVHQTKIINCLTHRESRVVLYIEDCIIDILDVFKNDGPIYQISSLLYRKELVEKEPDFIYFSTIIWDYPFQIFLALNGKVYFVNKTMSVYRLYTDGSWSLRNKGRNADISFMNSMILILQAVDKYSDYKYHAFIDKQILKFEYMLWRINPKFTLLKEERFYKLNFTKILKLFLRMLLP